jgi:hypothetical protein
MKKQSLIQMKPQDIVVICKLSITKDVGDLNQTSLSRSLYLSQSEISSSLTRSNFSGLLSSDKRSVNKNKLFDFIQFGLQVVFPVQPGEMTRGTLTAHSAPPLSGDIVGTQSYVWPYAKGLDRGLSITPLYHTIPQAILLDAQLYEILALLDAIRVGRVREKQLALKYLKQLLF